MSAIPVLPSRESSRSPTHICSNPHKPAAYMGVGQRKVGKGQFTDMQRGCGCRGNSQRWAKQAVTGFAGWRSTKACKRAEGLAIDSGFCGRAVSFRDHSSEWGGRRQLQGSPPGPECGCQPGRNVPSLLRSAQARLTEQDGHS